MKAAFYAGNETFRIGESTPIPPEKDEVRVEVAYCGVCGTDVHIFHGKMDQRVDMPQVIGHEVSGVVAETGADVAHVAPGDHVAVRPLKFGEPTAFDKGWLHVGKNLKFIGIDTPGGLQGSWTLPGYAVHKLPENVSLKHGALVEPIAVGCHARRISGLTAGENCVVLGGGPIGLLTAMVAREHGANVTVAEVNASRVKFAESLGFRAINPKEVDLKTKVEEITDGAMADVVFEVSGSASAAQAMTALPNVRGRIVVVAIHGEPREMNLFPFFWSEIRMFGARLYEAEDFEEALKLAASGRLPLDQMITRVHSIDETQQVVESINENFEGMKCLIQCNE